MHEQQNTWVVQKVYEKVAARDVEGLLALFAADIEWQVPAMDNVPFAGTWRGHDGLAKFFRTVSDTQEVVEFRPEQFIAQDRVVVVLGHFVMRVKATGRQSASDWAHVWMIDAGKVTHFREFVDTAAVIRAHSASLVKP
jgi:ketosteroid isomerase-like protein